MYSLRYSELTLAPMAVMLLPIALVIVQIKSQFAFRGWSSGESVLLTVTIDAGKA